jgi:hypothetical protein
VIDPEQTKQPLLTSVWQLKFDLHCVIKTNTEEIQETGPGIRACNTRKSRKCNDKT